MNAGTDQKGCETRATQDSTDHSDDVVLCVQRDGRAQIEMLLNFTLHVLNRCLDIIIRQGWLPSARRHGTLAFDDRGDEGRVALLDQRLPGSLVAKLWF